MLLEEFHEDSSFLEFREHIGLMAAREISDEEF
jgi:hypothetical protein